MAISEDAGVLISAYAGPRSLGKVRAIDARESSLSRRRFLGGAAGLSLTAASAALLASCTTERSPPVSAGARLETTRLRLVQTPSMCQSPQYVAQDLLRDEGFTSLEYVKRPSANWNGLAVASGEADVSMHFAGPVIRQIEAGDPIVVLAGAHAGCFELFATDDVRAIRDLKGRKVAIPEFGSPGHVYLAVLLAHVGLDPRTDVTWEVHELPEATRLLAEGRIGGYLSFPPEPQDLRARGIGHVVVNSLVDRPWSQYFCCMVIANREFVGRNPVATARALRGILNGVDQAGRDPVGAVRYLVDNGYTTQYDQTLEAVRTIHAAGWLGDYDAEDTLRYYALRLREAGMVRSSPDRIIARGTDWRFLAEVRRDRAATASAPLVCPIGGAGLRGPIET
jgi:NitT/TauT family transport system substrate-binding protein